MKIAHIMAGAPAGGAELFFERLCRAQHAAGDEILPIIRPDAARMARLAAAGLSPRALGFAALDPRTRPRLRRMLEDFAPRAVVAWMSRATARTPLGDWAVVGRLGGYYRLDHYRHCDHLVGNTRGIVAWLREQGWAAERSHYLPNFANDFHHTAPAADLPAGRPILLALGRLHSDKAFDILVRALPRLPGTRLVIAGEGPERGRLLRLAQAEGVADQLHLLPWRQDVGALLRAADIFVCPSRIEPLGNVVIEAWSAGTPVVAADADGPAELITHRINGLVVPREDPACLADAIATLLADRALAATLAAAGRHLFQSRFAEAEVLAQWRSFLAEVAPVR